MTAPAVQITAKGARGDVEAAAEALDRHPLLEATTYSLIEEDEGRGVWRLDAYPTLPEEAQKLKDLLGVRPGLSVALARLADADWLAMALSGLPPVRVGRFFVYGLHDRGRAPPNTVNLRIEAGAAFGTGHHGTTVGCLAALDRLLKRRRFARVLDVGAGTGILGIAAARTGSRIIRGTDIDPVSVRIARENARVNRAGARFMAASGLAHRSVQAFAPYDLVFANILARPLIHLSQAVQAALRPGGYAILSGLLRTQARPVLAAYLGRGLVLERRLDRDAWTTLILRRR